jgi:hypothetical protein
MPPRATRAGFAPANGDRRLERRGSAVGGEERDADIPAEWLAEFEAAARRSLETRMRYAFIRTYKPVLDDEPYRSFETMEEYRRWCEENLPDWLGYGRV